MKSKLTDRLLLAIAPSFAVVLIRILHFFLRTEIIGEENLRSFWKKDETVILSTWHDQLLMMINAYHGPGARILISHSKDGELIARTMEKFGQGAVRGSSSRGGRGAFRELVNLAKMPYDIGITPDGPKGPRHKVKPGVVQLARVTGRPIVPFAFACSNGHRFKSWDRFLLPYPWGRAVYHVGKPLSAHQNEPQEDFQSRVQQAMDANTHKAGEYLKQYDLSAV